jgi:hypothetical protein
MALVAVKATVCLAREERLESERVSLTLVNCAASAVRSIEGRPVAHMMSEKANTTAAGEDRSDTS